MSGKKGNDSGKSFSSEARKEEVWSKDGRRSWKSKLIHIIN